VVVVEGVAVVLEVVVSVIVVVVGFRFIGTMATVRNRCPVSGAYYLSTTVPVLVPF